MDAARGDTLVRAPLEEEAAEAVEEAAVEAHTAIEVTEVDVTTGPTEWTPKTTKNTLSFNHEREPDRLYPMTTTMATEFL